MNQGGSSRGRLFYWSECLYRLMGPEMVKSRPIGHPKLYICAISSTVGTSFSAYMYPRSF